MPSERPRGSQPRMGFPPWHPAAGLRPPYDAPGTIPGTCTPSSHPSDRVQPRPLSSGPCPPYPSPAQDSPLPGRARTAEDELAASQSRPAIHRLRDGRLEKEQFPLPGRSRVERLAHPLPGPSAPVPRPSYRSPPPPHPEIARDTRRRPASRGGGRVCPPHAVVPCGCGSAGRQVLAGQGNRPLGSHSLSAACSQNPYLLSLSLLF